jgi:hypothetical protein
MDHLKKLLDFATSATFQWIAFSVGFVGTLFGIYAWLEGRRKDRIYKYLFEAADKNIDKNLTEKQISDNKSEVARTSEQIELLRKRIETEIPIEAKRTVLKDRIDANILTLQTTLASTLDLKRQLLALGNETTLPSGLVKAVEAEILPEYVNNAQRETLKTYLIIVMVISALISAVIPSGLNLVVQIPLMVAGVAILSRLLRDYASRISQTADTFTLDVIYAALFAGALTSLTFAYFIENAHLPNHRWKEMPGQDIAASVSMTISISLIVFGVWFIKTKRGWVRWVLSSVAVSIAIPAALFSALLVYQESDLYELVGAYIFALFGLFLFGGGICMKMWSTRVSRAGVAGAKH